MLGAEALLAAVAAHHNRVGAIEAGLAREVHRFARLHQRLQAAVKLVDDLPLVLAHTFVMKLRRRDAHAEFAPTPRRVEQVGRLKQDLRRDTAAMQTGAAEFIAFDQRGAQPVTGGSNGGRVAAPAPTNHNDIKWVHVGSSLTLWGAFAILSRSRQGPRHSDRVCN